MIEIYKNVTRANSFPSTEFVKTTLKKNIFDDVIGNYSQLFYHFYIYIDNKLLYEIRKTTLSGKTTWDGFKITN